MDRLVYYLVTFAGSILAVFGIRVLLETPRYVVIERLDRGVEVREYEGRLAVETDARGQGDDQAFGKLFRYITGANQAGGRIAMTAPVEMGGRRIAMTAPVEKDAEGTMRFFLPTDVVKAGAPEPTEPGVRLVRVPPERIATLRFTGSVTSKRRARKERILSEVLEAAGRTALGQPAFMGYDPPFSIPFLRRNEVAVRLTAS